MKVYKTKHPDVIKIVPCTFGDERGFFMETYQKEKYSQVGITYEFVQDNQSSSLQGTLRGLHYQVTHVQGKLVRAIEGEIFDVAVDLRKSSPFFGEWVGAFLSAKDKKQLWIPPGFAHGFYTISPVAQVLYKATDYYDPTGERCICWNDPLINIDWPLNPQVSLILSSKDQRGKLIKDAEVFK
jgi:dTDP-4-dehydrorhamnose 3,5-epimerase